MNRAEIEADVNNIYDKYTNVLLECATGVGKSKLAINKMVKMVETDKNASIILLVAEKAHIENWLDEFKKWNFPYIDNVKIFCYASINKAVQKCDLLILDECHHSCTQLRRAQLFNLVYINHKQIPVVALSATVTPEIKYMLSDIFGYFYVYKVTMQNAIDWNILPNPKIHIIGLELNNTKKDCFIEEKRGNKSKYKTYNCDINDRWNFLRDKFRFPDIRLIISCTEKQKYDWLCERIDYYNNQYKKLQHTPKGAIMRNIWLQFASKRKKFLGDRKTLYVKEFLKTLCDSRYICFCSSIQQAEYFSADFCIHSEKNNSLKLINDFNNKKINKLFAIQMLQEGQNLVDIEAGIIVQLDGNDRGCIQKVGRVMRAKNPNIYIFYYKGTRDEEYLKAALEDINEDYVVYENIN